MHSFPTRPINALLALFVAITALGGCNSETAVTEPEAFWRRPQQGSSFTYDLWRTDTNGIRIPITQASYPDRVLSHDTTIDGRPGQLLVDHISFDELVYDYRNDNDIAIAFVARGSNGAPIRHPYVVYPVATRTPKVHPQVTVGPNFNTTVVRGSTTSYLGTDSVRTKAGTFLTHKILQVANDTTAGGVAFATADTIWFAPSLGTYVKKSNPPYKVAKRDGLEVLLTAYAIK